jgi:hypothetical protein
MNGILVKSEQYRFFGNMSVLNNIGERKQFRFSSMYS